MELLPLEQGIYDAVCRIPGYSQIFQFDTDRYSRAIVDKCYGLFALFNINAPEYSCTP